MSDLSDSAFGMDSNGPTEQELAAVEPFASQVRDNALAIIHAVFGKEATIGGVQVRPTSGAEVETLVAGDFFLVESSLQGGPGELHPCLTFLQRDELVAAFDLDLPTDPSDWSQQVDRVQNAVELLAEAINAQLGTVGQEAQPSLEALAFVRPSVRMVSLPDDGASLLLAPDESLVEVSYQLDVQDVGALSLLTIAATDMVRRLGGGAAPAGESFGPGAADLSDELLRLGRDFGPPMGRTPADLLDDLTPARAPQMGGRGMVTSSPGGSTAASFGRETSGARSAEFQQFDHGGERGPGANIDLIMDVTLKVTVELGRTTKSIREVLDLGPGAVVELDKLAGEPVDILVNDKPIAKGEVVVVDENFGVRVTDIISPARRVASLR